MGMESSFEFTASKSSRSNHLVASKQFNPLFFLILNIERDLIHPSLSAHAYEHKL